MFFMNQLHFIFLSIFFFSMGCDNPKKTDNSIDQVSISMVQNGMTILPSDGILRLDKGSFDMVLDMPKPMAVLVNATFFNDIAAEGIPLAEREEFQEGNTLAVSLFNEEQTIYMSEEASSPWFYESEKMHNFSKVARNNERYQCTRTINYFQGGGFEKIEIGEIGDPIYLTFVPSAIHEINPDSVDMLGKYFKIEWNETEPSAAVAVDVALAADESDTETPLYEEFPSLIDNVIEQLELDYGNVDSEFLRYKVNPANPKETIVFIPVTVEEDGEDFFQLSSYLVIADNETENIMYTYFEPNSIQSDAIYLEEISIDTFPYHIDEDHRAFGIKVSHRSGSQPNPYSTSVLSLYVRFGDKLTKILKDYTVSEFNGEGDAICTGEFTRQEKTLSMSTDQTNRFHDILVKNKITDTMTFKDKDGECNAEEVLTFSESVLKFNEGGYAENGEFFPVEVFLFNTKGKKPSLRNAPDGEPIFSINTNSEYKLEIAETNNGWSKVVKLVDLLDEDEVAIPNGEGWIKNTYIAATTRKEIGLMDAPEHGIEVGIIDSEKVVQIVEKLRDWILIEGEGISGWIEAEWLCGNPMTTCP